MLTTYGGQKLAQLIKKKRESMQMTQRGFTEWLNLQLPKESKISYGALQAWENEKTDNRPDLNNFFLLSRVFGVSADDFAKFLNDPEYEGIVDYVKAHHPEVEINPNMLLDLLRDSNKETAHLVVGNFIRELLDGYLEERTAKEVIVEKIVQVEKPIDAEKVEAFLKTSPKSQKIKFYHLLQQELIGA